ncbi:hypothetical protein D3C85_1628330 [compost metagenome]
MQAILVTLERAGLLTRTAHPEHGRVQKTELTEAGSKVLSAASKIVADVEARLHKAADPVQPQEARELLLRFAEALR